MNSAISTRRRPKTSTMSRIILLISFFILIGRLLFIIPGAIEHHQQKKAIPEPVTLSTSDSR
ncbi:YfgG family protein [Pantoea sp. BRR-3P]|uniref:YfgG family protein n=1 Tax=Pantoea sp. BRR-3P TaxID=3141541 RepID=UPI0031F4A6C8